MKGTKVYVHGRLATRSWTGQDGIQKSTTEIVIDDMIVLSGIKPREAGAEQAIAAAQALVTPAPAEPVAQNDPSSTAVSSSAAGQDVSPEDIPF